MNIYRCDIAPPLFIVSNVLIVATTCSGASAWVILVSPNRAGQAWKHKTAPAKMQVLRISMEIRLFHLCQVLLYPTQESPRPILLSQSLRIARRPYLRTHRPNLTCISRLPRLDVRKEILPAGFLRLTRASSDGPPMEPPCAAPRNLNPNEPTIYGPNEPCRANPTPSRYAPRSFQSHRCMITQLLTFVPTAQIPGPRLYRRFYV